MKPELRDRIIAYNKSVAEKAEKATDLDTIIAAIKKMPPGQMKKFLSDDVLLVLAKYGVLIE